MRWALVALTAIIAAGVAWWMWREKARGDVLALGLVLGGAAGNILDRARFGYVVDYADLHFGEWRPFLVFNVADAAITVGVVILLLRALFVRDGKTPEPPVEPRWRFRAAAAAGSIATGPTNSPSRARRRW
jgi:signal peptidase II